MGHVIDFKPKLWAIVLVKCLLRILEWREIIV